MNNIKSILFFEPDIRGHQLDYIEHLCSFKIKNDVFISFIFIVNHKFYKTLDKIKKRELFSQFNEYNIQFVEMKESEVHNCITSNLIKSAFYRWYFAKEYALLYNTDHIHFLYLDHLQLPLAFRLNYKYSFTISGILFNITLHYKDTSRNILVRLKRILNRVLYQGMLNNNNFISAFSLDSFFEKYALDHLKNGVKIKNIPDPSLFKDKYSAYKNDLIDFSSCNRKLFVLFGYIQKRKGVFQLLESIHYIDKSLDSDISICIAGRIEESISDHILQEISMINNSRKKIKIEVMNKFLTDKELVSLVVSSDCILAPYQNFTGSSGVLLWAAGAGKPIITQNYGLIGKWVESFKLGLAVDTTNPKMIANAINTFLKNSDSICDFEKMKSFTTQNTPDKFSEIIFNNIIFKNL